jgi:hypothetical protein
VHRATGDLEVLAAHVLAPKRNLGEGCPLVLTTDMLLRWEERPAC